MKYVEEPVKVRPWYKKPLVLVTIAASVLLILGSAYFLTRPKKTINPFTNFPSIHNDTPEYTYGPEISAVLLHMHNLSKPGGEFRKNTDSIVEELESDPRTSTLMRLIRSVINQGTSNFFSVIKRDLRFTALRDLSHFFEKLNIPISNQPISSMAPEQEFQVILLGDGNEHSLLLERVRYGVAVAIISHKGIFLRNVNDEYWHTSKDFRGVFHNSAMEYNNMIVYQQAPDQERN